MLLPQYKDYEDTMTEWLEFSFKLPTAKSGSDGAVDIDRVYHVAHISSARRILEDGQIRAGLIYDESRLNTTRTSVSWFSANTWGNGSIYGSVQFAFSWSDLSASKQFYWVEAIKKYNPPAFRILLSERTKDQTGMLTPYNPSSECGPLRTKDDIWYRNRNLTSEFMIDGNIDLSRCIDLDFVTHNQDICRMHGASCREKLLSLHRVGARMLSFVIGNDIHVVDHALKRPSCYDAKRPLSEAVDAAVSGIRTELGAGKKRFGGKIKSAASRGAVMRGAMALFGADQKIAAEELLSLLASEDIFRKALEETINAHFGIEGWCIEF